MNENHKLILEKLAFPIIATVVGAALVAYFVSEPRAPARLVLENLTVRDSSTDGINKFGSWRLIPITSEQRDRLRPAYIAGLRNGDDKLWRDAIDSIWYKQDLPALTTISAQKRCNGLGASEFLPEVAPNFNDSPDRLSSQKIQDSPLYGLDNSPNSNGVVYYVINWSLDTQLSDTFDTIVAGLNLDKSYSYPSQDSIDYVDANDLKKFRLNSAALDERCTALRGAILERMQKQVIAGDENWQATPPLLDILVRNTGQVSGTITGVSAKRVWILTFDCGPSGNAIKPGSAPIVLPIASTPTTAHLTDAISLDPLGTTRLQILLDSTPSESGCGSEVAFDVFVNYFDGVTTQRLRVGRFDLPTMAGGPV